MSRMTASFKWILGFLATGALMFLFLVNLRAFHSPSNFFDQSRAFQGFHFSSALNATGDPLHECVLPKIDPWDPEVLRLVDPSHDPLRGCKPTFVRRSRVKDGLLLVNQTAAQLRDGEKCFFRCLLPVDDWALEFGEWLPVGANGSRPQCDVFDVQCNQTNTTTYKFLHTQIREQPPSKVKPPAGSPDVYVIVLDSVSISQVFRSMPVTTHFLRAEMDAVFFPYANKVGLNSAPNGYGFLVGEQAENSLPNPWGKADLKGRWDELCKRPLEKENTIVADFRNRGYRMMMVEDWANGVTTYPNCIGFASPPVDHFMKPFAVRYDGENKYKDWETRSFLFEKLCLETYHYVLPLTEEFIGKYPQQPKFSFSWITNLAHDDESGLYHVDQQFRDFFARNKQKLRNAFVVFMGDHGMRWGKVRRTRMGELEEHNPLLAIVVPEHLRGESGLMKQMHTNSQQLISHFDLYATLLEIAEQGAEWNKTTDFSATSFVPSNRTLLGSSLLHPLPQPRTCESLHIPFQYCLCQHEFSLVEDESIAVRVAELAVAKMNEEIARSEYRDNCTRLSVDREQTARLELQEFKPQGGRRIFRVNFRLLPSGGLYDTFAEMTGDSIRLIAENFPRRDSYEKQANCIPENFIRNYCFCPQSSA